ncbi:S-adenosyl-L-methionine-dependent methyltransferase [Echria macrotheca]|uniref:S-adenosyl-L-methionine-dependent methyltransferase n=1 Tax=Echria macrotheca TaxID=438768 RepID=A0AAJ0BJ85_9PEZI|nr:S-adenosyl-L-methionine-dependent methyltransferase [Echria macrotheca]
MFKYGRYPLPNDDDEYKREAMRHTMLKELLGGKLFLAPIGDSPQKIVDLGTGFGEWAIEMGELFPSAQVLGVDLSPIQPVWIPPNVEFIVDDIEDEWVYANDFDYVHLRIVGMSIRDNGKLHQSILDRNLKPGGWLEVQEVVPHPGSDDGTIPPDSALLKFYTVCGEVFQKTYGFDMEYAKHVPEDLERRGFINVEKKVWHAPIGDWPRDPKLRTIGGYMREIIMDFAGAMAARPFVEYGMDKTEIDELLVGLREALGDRRVHAYLPLHYIWGQKPPAGP